MDLSFLRWSRQAPDGGVAAVARADHSSVALRLLYIQ
jgi:hypothetical protein